MNEHEQFGICMAGNELQILECLLQRIETKQPIFLVELGSAEGRTLTSLAKFILSYTPDFKCVGVDIEQGWSLNTEAFHANKEGLNEDQCSMSLMGSQAFLPLLQDESVDFLLIDACHSFKCCTDDFLAGENKVKIGGFVCFHDSDEACQGLDQQPHCGQPIQVRQAVKELGLLDNTRPGWTLVHDLTGDKTQEGRGVIIVQRK